MGHTAGIHTRSRDIARAFGTEMPASRVVVNTPTTHGAIGFSTALPPSMTLGCGSWGGNVTSDNISPWHLMDIKRVAFETRPVASKRPARSASAQPQTTTSPLSGRRQAPAPATVAAGGGNVSREEIAKIVDRFLGSRATGAPAPQTSGAPLPVSPSTTFVQAEVDIEPHRVSSAGGVSPQPDAAPNARPAPDPGPNGGATAAAAAPRQGNGKQPEAQPPASNGRKAVAFVCEDDVRRAIQRGEKIYVNAKTIITPSARDIGDPAEVFAKV